MGDKSDALRIIRGEDPSNVVPEVGYNPEMWAEKVSTDRPLTAAACELAAYRQINIGALRAERAEIEISILRAESQAHWRCFEVLARGRE